MASHKPLIDPFQIDRIMKEAKIERIQYLRNKVETGAGAARWGGLTTLVASCFALFVSHGTTGQQDTTGGENGSTITHVK